MRDINTFIPETPPYFVDFRISADKEFLEVKFRRDAKIQVNIKRFVMRLKRFRVAPPASRWRTEVSPP